MLLEMNQWHLGYSQLLSDVRTSAAAAAAAASGDGRMASPQSIAQFGAATGGTVLLLVNPDVDALAAARIVTYALRADGVPYQLRPCGGYGQLVRILTKLSGDGRIGPAMNHDGGGGKNGGGGGGLDGLYGDHNDDDDDDDAFQGEDYNMPPGGGSGDIRAVVLLNLGANRNLTRLYRPNGIKKRPTNGDDNADDQDNLDVNPEDAEQQQPPLLPPTTRLYVLDSHRPYHLANIHSARSVVLFNDRAWDDDVPSDGDNLSGEEVTTDEDSDDDSSDEEEDEEPEDLGQQDAEGSDAEVEFDDDGDVQGEGREQPQDGDGDDQQQQQQQQDYDADQDDDPFHEDEDDDDDDEDNDDNNADRRRKKRRKTEGSSDGHGDGSGSGSDRDGREDAADDDSLAADRRELDAADHQQDGDEEQEPPVSVSQLRQERRSRIRVYYASGSHHSSPVSWMAYTLLSTQLRYSTVGDLLWLACVGVTDSYLHGRIDKAGYATFAQDLRRHVRRVYPDDDIDRASSAAYAELLDGAGLSNAYSGPHTQLSLSENGKILTQNDEYRFYLLRHTSLWNAMMYSPYVCAKMQLWNGAGMGRWREMLAKMGLPLEQCQQPYAFMKPGLKRRLREVISEHAEDYGLDGLSYTGFIRITGYRSLLSASDMCYAITALLECEAGENQANALDDGSGSSEEEREDVRLMHSFNAAYDALGSSNAGSVEGSDQSTLVNGGTVVGGDSGAAFGLGGGIKLALSLQKAIIQTAISLVDRKAITRLSHFRYAYIHCTSRGSAGGGLGASGPAAGPSAVGNSSTNDDEKSNQPHIFAKPLALTRLAHFLMDIHRANGKWTGNKSRPLVLLAEKPQTDTYVVVGYEFPESTGDVVRNRFGQNFDLAARTMNGTFKFDSFDSNVVEVKSSHVQRFVEQLHYILDAEI